MFVATVPDKIHGAGVIAYPNFMEDAAQKMGGDFFVLPSSIHEVLLVKDNGQMTAKELENMVKEVNATQVEPADQLTDHVYHYDSQNHIFELADKYEERMKEAEHDAVADKDSVLGDLKEKKQEIAKKDPAKDAATKAATKKHEASL
jgi:gamma-glutamylcysteine synthetase